MRHLLTTAAFLAPMLAALPGAQAAGPAPAAAAAPEAAASQPLSPAGEGRRAWLKFNCYGCHGMFASGGMGPNVTHAGDDVGEAVRQGEDGGMPAFSRRLLTSRDISNLQAYLRSIGTPSEPKFMDWWVTYPPK